jgi:hypothetical protein
LLLTVERGSVGGVGREHGMMADVSVGKRAGVAHGAGRPYALERILDAAFRAFATYGYDGLLLSD